MPAERGSQIPCGLQMLGDQSGVLVDRARVVLFDRGGQPTVEFGAPGLQLRLVCDGADQWVPKHVLGVRSRRHSIDELGLQQLVDGIRLVVRLDQSSKQVGPKRAPMTAAAYRNCLAGVLRRSIRAAMVACSVPGTPMSATS